MTNHQLNHVFLHTTTSLHAGQIQRLRGYQVTTRLYTTRRYRSKIEQNSSNIKYSLFDTPKFLSFNVLRACFMYVSREFPCVFSMSCLWHVSVLPTCLIINTLKVKFKTLITHYHDAHTLQ